MPTVPDEVGTGARAGSRRFKFDPDRADTGDTVQTTDARPKPVGSAESRDGKPRAAAKAKRVPAKRVRAKAARASETATGPPKEDAYEDGWYRVLWRQALAAEARKSPAG
ncbi:MAG: hypothetical protein ACT4PO_16415 [Actinomycetota bacterium]